MEKSLKKGNRFSTLIRKTGVLWVMIVLYAVSVCVDPSHFLTAGIRSIFSEISR